MFDKIYPAIPSSTTIPSAPMYIPDNMSSYYNHTEPNYSDNFPPVPTYHPSPKVPQMIPPTYNGSSSVHITINHTNVPNYPTNITINSNPINDSTKKAKGNTEEPFIVVNCPTNYFIANNPSNQFPNY